MSRLKNANILSKNKRTNVDYVWTLSSLAVIVYQPLIKVKIFSKNVQAGIRINSFRESTILTTIIIFNQNPLIIVYLYQFHIS